jgi:hypothetical protein
MKTVLFERDYSIKPKDVDDFFDFRRITEEAPVFSEWDKEKRTLFVRSSAKCAFICEEVKGTLVIEAEGEEVFISVRMK